MWLTPGLLALAALGAEGPDGPSRPIAPVRYQVRVLEMKGIDWRGKWHDRLEPVARQGNATIWTADRALVPALVESAERVVGDPKLAAAPSASATVRHEVGRHLVADLKRVADGPFGRAHAVAFQPQIDRITESFQATISCRRISQGVLAKVAIEDSHLAAIHVVALREGLEPEPPEGGGEPRGTNLTANYQVPELVSSQVDGEWLIPNDGVLVVSLGVHTRADAQGKAQPEERLAVVETRDEPTEESTTSKADADARRASNVVTFPVPPTADAAPAVGRPTPVRMSVTIGAPFVFPFSTSGPPTPGVHAIAGGREVVPPAPPTPAANLPTPPPPSRHLPTPIGPDGKVTELPPLPDEDLEPAADESESSAEPRPTPQTRPAPNATAPGESKPADKAPDAKPADPAVVNEVVKTFLLLAKRPPSPNVSADRGGSGKAKPFETRFATTQAPAAPPCASTCEPASAPSRLDVWSLTLRDAIRIALDNSEVVRVVRLGAQGVGGASAEIPLAFKNVSGLACEVEGRRTANHPEKCGSEGASRVPTAIVGKLCDDVSDERFKAEVAAMVRSVEQQYWALSAQQAKLRASEAAVGLVRRILERERAKYHDNSGSVPNVAEAEENYERCQLRFVSDTANVITAERQLRNILGLPPADGRRIVPVTAPISAVVEHDWDSCLGDMAACQPDLVLSREAMRAATARMLATLAPIGPCAMIPGLAAPTASCDAAEACCEASQEFLRSRAFHQQVLHQTTHSLARMFLEVDANNRQRQTARQLEAAAKQRLDAQKGAYEAGQITIDRYLDAVNRWAAAVAQEAEFQGLYSTAIVALEEAKGTLLEFDDIHVIGKRQAGTRVAASEETADLAVGRSSFEPADEAASPTPMRVEAGVVNARIVLDPDKVRKEPTAVRIVLPGGDVMEIRASVTKAPASPPKCCTDSCESGSSSTGREGAR